MNHTADKTAHRYYSDTDIACALHELDRGFAMIAGEEAAHDWPGIPAPHRRRWLSAVQEYRRGTTARDLYESLTGLPWSSLDRREQARMEMGQLLARGMASTEL